VEKDLLPAVGKESMRVISKAMPPLNKRSMGILFEEPIHIHTGKHFRGMRISEHACLRSTFLNMLS
jgi:hypothetical protein